MAAGLGTRLRPITHAIPKPVVPVGNVAIVEQLVRLLAAHGVDEVIANLHWFPEQVRGPARGRLARSASRSPTAHEEELLGTAGGVRNVADFLTAPGEDFLVLAGDALTDADLTALMAAHRANDGVATLGVKKVADVSEYGVIVTGSDGRVQGFQEKPDPAEALSDLCNCMVYAFSPEVFDYFPRDEMPDPVDFANDVFPALLRRATSPSTSTRSTPTGTTSGRCPSTCRGTSTPSTAPSTLPRLGGELGDGAVPERPRAARRRRGRGQRSCSATAARSAPGASLTGPLVIGAGAVDRSGRAGQGGAAARPAPWCPTAASSPAASPATPPGSRRATGEGSAVERAQPDRPGARPRRPTSGPATTCSAPPSTSELELEATETGEFSIASEGFDAPTDRSNLIVRAFESLHPADGISFRVRSEIPLARGLGSSASAILAGLLAADHLFELANDREQILALATEIEGHPDNVAASLYGGVTLCPPAARRRCAAAAGPPRRRPRASRGSSSSPTRRSRPSAARAALPAESRSPTSPTTSPPRRSSCSGSSAPTST